MLAAAILWSEMDAVQTRMRFLNRLRQFVLFHLGSDAEVTVSPTAEGLEIKVQHQRVTPMLLQFSSREIGSLLEDHSGFEDRLLSYLTRHRRS